MKRIFIFIMIISIAFSLASCNYADPSGSIDPNKEVADDNREEANDNQNNQTEHNDSETDITDRTAEYVARSMETFLLDFDGNLYDQRLRLEFFRHLRGEQRFADAQQLKEQIHRDIALAREFFAQYSE